MLRTKRLSRSQGTSRTTGGVEHNSILIDEHVEEVSQHWLGFLRHVLVPNCWSGVSVSNSSNNLAVASAPEKAGFIDLSGTSFRIRNDTNDIGFHPDEGHKINIPAHALESIGRGLVESIIALAHSEPKHEMGAGRREA